jgi:Pyridoxamine 5'-phosphate oxidase
MATVYPELTERLIKFIRRQPVFFVATAPCLDAAGNGGHVNVSPKGYKDTFAVIDPLTVAYLDLTGSGAETVAHLRQNGRITIMFCSFTKQAKILRIYGTGRVVLPGEADWEQLASYFSCAAEDMADAAGANGMAAANGANGMAAANGANGLTAANGAAATGPTVLRRNQRSIIVVEVDRVSDSCGYAVPIMRLTQERDLLMMDAQKRSPEGWDAYRVERNSVSIDGLPALG